MRLWGKTQAELDAERQQAIARREYLAQRDDELRGKSPGQLAKFYADRLPNTDSTGQFIIPGSAQRQYFFGEDIERFDSVPSEMHAFGREEAAAEPYGWRWAVGIALTVLAIGMIAMALAMLP